jgi:acetoin utilization deacetylase AcuC-like enzyme
MREIFTNMLKAGRLYHCSKHERLRLFYCDHYDFPLPAGHKFPLPKYRLLRERLVTDLRLALEPSRLATRETVSRVHTPDYVDAFLTGNLDAAAMRRIGFIWSPQLVDRTLASVGGTLLATAAALESGFGGTLASGTHHAFRDEGSGFWVFNDIAIAIAWAQAEWNLERAAVVDLDVHQGDGTAAIFALDPRVFTLSVHSARNFPFRKQASVLDIELPDRADDDTYLRALEPALARVWDFAPQLLFFQSGVDALAGDRLGRLSLTHNGLALRDAMVIEQANSLAIPLVITLGGGYAEPIQNTLSPHAQTFLKAADVYCCDETFTRARASL